MKCIGIEGCPYTPLPGPRVGAAFYAAPPAALPKRSVDYALGFDGYFETSAREGWGIETLITVIRGAIDWNRYPKVSSTNFFQRIKGFLDAEKEAGQLLSTVDELYSKFMKLRQTQVYTTYEHLAEFEICLGQVESLGLIRRLGPGNLILLQPKLLNVYALALINAVKDEPDGLGSIAEEKVHTGNFFVPEERLKDKGQEKWLLMAMVEDLLRHEIALREKAYDGSYLVFPSQFTCENSELLNPEGEAVIFGFEGPVQNIYVTLIVQLTHSGVFRMQKLWKNAVTYTTRKRGTYGIYLRNIREKQGELVLFFDKAASEESCSSFEEYVQTHLQHRAFSNSIQRYTVFTCSACGFRVSEQLIGLLAERGFDWLNCPVPTCGTYISLVNREERLNAPIPLRALEMTPMANLQSDREVAKSNIQGKKESKVFDVFLCHNNEDKPAVRRVAKQLQEQGILPWLDEWELQPGLPWQRVLEDQIMHIKAAVVFVGKEGVGPYNGTRILDRGIR